MGGDGGTELSENAEKWGQSFAPTHICPYHGRPAMAADSALVTASGKKGLYFWCFSGK
jgi:hypothetical protein